jgi:glycosyltransferase involved in cell wall biosynthesis
MIAPEVIPVPPTHWGGTESVVRDLSWALAELGHEVTLIAVSGSKAPPRGRLIETFSDTPSIERHFNTYKSFVEKFNGAVHDHSNGKLAWRINTHVVNTVHWCQHPSAMGYKRMVAVSHTQAKWLSERCPTPRKIPVVHHGIDLNRFTFREEKKDHYLFFSVIGVYKGALEALRIAKETGVKMVFAGMGGDASNIVKNCGLPNVTYVGEVSDEERARLLSEARALIFPTGAFGKTDWLEVFGLVQLEALASGTPIIASNNGACPEVVEHGAVGYICNSYDEMLEVVRGNYVDKISPLKCRRYVEEKFSSRRMALEYLDLYHKALRGETW